MQQTIPWGELASMLVVLTGVFGGINFLIVKVVMMPQLAKLAKDQQLWAKESFPSKDQFAAHCEIDEERHAHIQRELNMLRKQPPV